MQSLIPSSYDIYLFHQGTLFYSYKLLGAHLLKENGIEGVRFAVWAKNALAVQVVGDFNNWDGNHHSMKRVSNSDIWFLFIPGLQEGEKYKYLIITKNGNKLYKADPLAFYAEVKPKTASIVYQLSDYPWEDKIWQDNKEALYEKPLNIYEMHMGTWKKKSDGSYFSYRELANELIDYVADLGYTHIEIMPLSEHPYDRSWGYQITGYYAITSRYGTPDDFRYFVDQCHQKNIGVILDWVPGHFVKDEHGLRLFDGSPLYEHEHPFRAEKKDWGTLSFDLGKTEVQSFLISNAIFLMDVFHIDGLRVDAVASMLYLDFGREIGEWQANQYGGRENLEAIAFFKKLNEAVFSYFPQALMIAEESTAWPLVSAPTYLGGLGFNFKWNMGWMNDMLKYMEMDPIYRKYHHNLLTFSFFYAFSENYVLPLSHDEVVYGKKSLLNKMHGDYWQKFAGLRLFLAYMFAHPGKKLLFMGGEFGQFDEWKDLTELDWQLLEFESHKQFLQYVKELNQFYRQEKALFELDHHPDGFTWIDPHDSNQSIVTFMRHDKEGNYLVILGNFTPNTYENYRIGVPDFGVYQEIFNSDSERFGGSGKGNNQASRSEMLPWHNQRYSLNIQVPPLAIIMFKLLKKATGSFSELNVNGE